MVRQKLAPNHVEELREATRAANLALAEMKEVFRQIRAERVAVDRLIESVDAMTRTAVEGMIERHVVEGMELFTESARKAAHDAYERVQKAVDRLVLPILSLVAEKTGQEPPEAFTRAARFYDAEPQGRVK
jgi:cell division protein ZapA (FtsZ GTPase activity inhibitor)